MKFIRYISLGIAAMLLLLCVPYAGVFAEDATEAVNEQIDSEYVGTDKTTLLNSSFDNDSYDGWSPFGGQCTLALDDSHSNNGSSSLHVYDRQASWTGACINVTKYISDGDNINFELRLNPYNATVDTQITLTLRVTDVNGKEDFITIDQRNAQNGMWSKFEGSVEIPVNTIDALFYVEATDSDTSYYLDNVTISKCGFVQAVTTPIKASDDPEYTFDFEKNIEGWLPRGATSLAVSTKFAYTGQNSLQVSGREKSWAGPTVRLDRIQPEKSYTYSAYVMYGGKEYEDEHTFCIELQYTIDGVEYYSNISSKKLQNGTWSKISGTFTVPKNATDIYFYVQTEFVEDDFLQPNDLMPFYIDSISVIESSIITRRQLKNTLIKILAATIILAVLGTIVVLIVLKSRKTRAALRIASLDFMTKAYNRNAFETLTAEFTREPDKLKKLYITACDVNFLKYINDNYGHESGDRAITRCAAILIKAVGKKGKVFRTGGDEFVCFSPENPLKKINEEYVIESNKYEGYPFSVACGTIIFEQKMPGEKPDIERLLAKADQAMYTEKQRIKMEFTQFSGMNSISVGKPVVNFEEAPDLDNKNEENHPAAETSEPLHVVSNGTTADENTSEISEDSTDVSAETTEISKESAEISEDLTEISEDTAEIREDLAEVSEDTAEVSEDSTEESEEISG